MAKFNTQLLKLAKTEKQMSLSDNDPVEYVRAVNRLYARWAECQERNAIIGIG